MSNQYDAIVMGAGIGTITRVVVSTLKATLTVTPFLTNYYRNGTGLSALLHSQKPSVT